MKHDRKLIVLTLLALLLVSVVPLTAQDDEDAEVEPIETGIDVVDEIQGFPAYNLPTDQIEVLEDLGDTVLVRHRFGETEVPKNPQRVFADAATLPLAMSLNLPIVGGYYWEGAAEEAIPGWEELVAEAQIEPVTTYAYNFELLLELEPDLILAFSHIIYGGDNPETVYENLSAIAPTIVVFNDPTELWPQAMFELSQLFELSDEAATSLENAGETIAEACEPLQELIGDESVVFIQPIGGDVWVIGAGWMDGENFLPYSLTSHFYYFCGLNPPENLFDLVGTGSIQISQELIPEIQADHLFVDTYDTEVDHDELLSSPLWQAVHAVQNGQVYLIDNVFSGSYDMTLYAIEEVTSAVVSASESE
ncbi:MAG: ABC transporter substrate-binding protein [Chloroflexota bacterium]